VADVLGLEQGNASLKIGFAAPEVMRCSERARALAFAEVLSDTGMNVKVIDGADLARVPWPLPVSWMSFGPDALLGTFRGRTVQVHYEEPVLAVFCKPPLNYTRPPSVPPLTSDRDGLGIAEALDGIAILDLYVVRGAQLERFTIAQDVTDLSDLGERRGGSPAESLKATLAVCGQRFERLTVDARLENVRPRRRFVPGEAGFDVDLRKHYSFGTLLLRHALGEISEGLADLTHYEYGSRLACVLGRDTLG
jgi:hypothetical protein